MFDQINRQIDAAVNEAAEELGISTDALYIAFLAIVFAFAAGFVYGYNVSVEHFLDAINKHQIERGLPTFTREWTGA